jgi:hypothetical protein
MVLRPEKEEDILGDADADAVGHGSVKGFSRGAGWVLVGVLVGVFGTPVWNHPHRDGRQTDTRNVDVGVSLAAQAGELNVSSHVLPVVNVPVVIHNAGNQSVTLVAIKVKGPGAGYVQDVPGGPPAGLPRELPPGRFVWVRFGLSADCSAPLLPEPRVTLVLRKGQSVLEEPVQIPDLVGVWGQVRGSAACRRP